MGKQIHRVGAATSSSSTLLLLLSLIIVITSDNISTVDGQPDTTVLSTDCGTAGTWNQGDPYGDLVNDLLDDLATQTPDQESYIYSDTKSDDTSSVYGTAQCGNTNLNPDECLECLNQCITGLANSCMFSNSATITLVDCQMRYERQT